MLSRTRKAFSSVVFCSVLGVMAGFLPATRVYADNAQFDLQGPTLEVKVQRDGRTLPIAEVPNLQPGDRLWLHPVLGEHESVHYLMVAVFLRGSTNPPPDEWFHKVEAWNKDIMEEGTYILVPPGAEQAVVLFAPQTGGDFSTLKSAVRGRPGSFVRASQDLTVASLDRARINTYLKYVRAINDPEKVKAESNTLARSLSLKLNQECFDRPSDQQASCLQQSQSALILDNGSSATAQALLNGPTSDLALQAGYTPGMSAGLYDPYISVALDIGKILASFHSAQYQYIPGLPDNDGVDMNLWLNAPPSFHNPKSVIVVALPPIQAAEPPRLEPVDPKQVFCMQKSPLVLPVDNAPEVFATQYAHGLMLHLQGNNNKTVDLPVRADAEQGGFLLPAPVLKNAGLGDEVKATVQGYWGFDAYTGPSFKLRSTYAGQWTVAASDKSALVVGRSDELHLQSAAAACVESVSFRDPSGTDQTATFKPSGSNGIVATLPLADAQPGPILVSIQQYGLKDPNTLSIPGFAEVGKYEDFRIHAGDHSGVLTGTRLDGVASVEFHGISFSPVKLTRKGDTDSLQLEAPAPAKNATGASSLAQLQPGDDSVAQAHLKDGRTVPVPAIVEDPRPSVTLIHTYVQLPATAQPLPPVSIKLGADEELPLNGQLTFSLKTVSPDTFSRGESVEIATADGLESTTFSLASGQLVLQDATTAIGVLNPAKSFGASAFGPLRLRPVLADGTTGDWVPLATLVRVPSMESYTCPPETSQPCTLKGNGLYLLDSVAPTQQFLKPITVPDGYASNTLQVPRVTDGQLYAKLRDDAAIVNTITVPLPPVHIARHSHHKPETRDGAPDTTTTTADAPAPGDQGTDSAPGSSSAPSPAPATTPTTAPMTTPTAAPTTTTAPATHPGAPPAAAQPAKPAAGTAVPQGASSGSPTPQSPQR
jgi:hypothetical protein